MARLALTRNIRFVEALAFVALVFRLLANLSPGGAEASLLTGLLALVMVLMLAGLAWPLVRQVSWVALLVCGLGTIVVQPLEADGLLWVLGSLFAMVNSHWFARQPLVATGLAAALVLGAQVWALVAHPESRGFLAVGMFTADAVLAFLLVTFRHDLLGPTEEQRPVLQVSAYGLTARERQVVSLAWRNQTAKEIAFALGITEATARKDLSNLYQKFGVVGAKELYVLSLSHRVVLEDEA